MGNGVTAPVRGPAETLARMARVVGVSPDDLEQVGRPDAAAALRTLQAKEALVATDRPVPYDPYGELAGLSDDERLAVERTVVEMARAFKRARGVEVE